MHKLVDNLNQKLSLFKKNHISRNYPELRNSSKAQSHTSLGIYKALILIGNLDLSTADALLYLLLLSLNK